MSMRKLGGNLSKMEKNYTDFVWCKTAEYILKNSALYTLVNDREKIGGSRIGARDRCEIEHAHRDIFL